MKSSVGFWLLVPGALFVIVSFLFPLVAVFQSGLWQGLPEVLKDPYLRRVILFTYQQAFISAFLAGLIGTLAAFLYSEMRFPGRRMLWLLGGVSFALPTILFVLSFIGFWGRNGPVALGLSWLLGREYGFDFYGWPAVLAGHAFFNFPIFLKIVGQALSNQDRRLEMTALSLGANRTFCFFRVTLKRIAPALLSAFLLAFLFCSASFLIVLLLGGGPHFTTLEVAVFQATRVDLNLPVAAALAAIQCAVLTVVHGAAHRWGGEGLLSMGKGHRNMPLYLPRTHLARMALVSSVGVGLFFLAVAPSLYLLISGVAGIGRLDWSALFHAAVTSFRLALLTAVLSSCAALSLAYFAAHAKAHFPRVLVSLLATLPLAVSTLVLTLGMLLAYSKWLQPFRGSLIVISLVQSVACLPLIFPLWREAFSQVPEGCHKVAASLGAGPWRRFFKLDLPLVRNAGLVGVLLAAMMSLSEMGTGLIFYSEDLSTLPLEIYRLMSRYQFDEAYTVGSFYLLLVVGLAWWVGRFNREAL